MQMGIGVGVVLVLAGLILVLDVVNYDIPRVDDHELGWLLVVVGALSIVLSLIFGAMASRRRVEVDRRDSTVVHHDDSAVR
ncbi:DUF6458 family protein [Nocardioides montaniterrae]